jgi:hypothetical protein
MSVPIDTSDIRPSSFDCSGGLNALGIAYLCGKDGGFLRQTGSSQPAEHSQSEPWPKLNPRPDFPELDAIAAINTKKLSIVTTMMIAITSPRPGLDCGGLILALLAGPRSISSTPTIAPIFQSRSGTLAVRAGDGSHCPMEGNEIVAVPEAQVDTSTLWFCSAGQTGCKYV